MDDDGTMRQESVDPALAAGAIRRGAQRWAIDRLWINGAPVLADGAELVIGEGGGGEPPGDGWSVQARLPAHNPFAKVYGISLQLVDGRTAHGRARLADADGADVVFRGDGGLDGSIGSRDGG